MNAQQTFDTIVNHLRKQGGKSVVYVCKVYTYCAYRGAEGRKCAAGCLIPDSIYTKNMEGFSFCAIIDMNENLYYLRPFTNMIGELQSMHDAFDVTEWEDEMKAIAHRYEVIYTPKENK